MIRAIYRWRVKSGEEEKFIQAWTQGTAAIRAKVVGAGGSLLMRSHHDRSEFMALACWHSIEDWQAFAAENDSAPPDPEAFRVMGAVSEHLSTEILEEVADLLDCGPGPGIHVALSAGWNALSYSEERECVEMYGHIY